MAKTLPTLCFILLTITFFSTLTSAKSGDGFAEKLSPSSLRLKREKLTHLHFFFHDVVSGQNPTAVEVARDAITNTSDTQFGSVNIIDDPLTVSPDPTSKLVGKAQGMYVFASQSELALLMALNFAFTDGKFNGSTLSLLGRNAILTAVREMPIVGGSGVFRFARGFAQARTHTFDRESGDAVVEYNVYVFHY